jgi:hypothetical protein
MKATLILTENPVQRCAGYLLILFSVTFYLPCRAQTPVTSVYTHWANATTGLSYAGTGATGNASSGYAGNDYAYDFGTDVTATNNIQYLDSFTALGLNYHFQTVSQKIYFRRVNNASVTGLRKSLWFDQSSGSTVNPNGTADLIPAYDDSLERLFSEHIFNIGIDNNFQNAATTNNNNIERVDVIFPGGVSATDVTKAGFVVFDRGNAGTHDPFYIAAIKTLDGNGNPSAYYDAVSVVAGNYGSSIGGALNFLVMRENPGDGHLLLMNNTANQNRDGVLLRFTDLGVAEKTGIYGYSLFGTDVTVTPATNMVDYTNTTNFPTGSDFSNGGIDQIAVTGLWVTNASYVVLADEVDGFQAWRTEDNKVQLSWTLGMTEDLQQLVVERCGNGKDFLPWRTLSDPELGLQTELDAQPLPGVNDYRLKLVDNAGGETYSAVCSVTTSQTAPFSLLLYPNPVQNRSITLAVQGLKQAVYELRILDMASHLIHQQLLTGQSFFVTNISLPAWLPAGMYVVEMTDANGRRVGDATTFAMR